MPFDTEQRRVWFEQFAPNGRYRLLVAECGHELVGYASSVPLKPKLAYATSVETSVYLLPGAVGDGLGSQLYAALFASLHNEDVHRAYAVLALPNEVSRALHLKLGFKPLHVLREVGKKFGRYIDTEWFEKALN